MNRETTNWMRFVLEDVLPPVSRDSSAFRWLASLFWGDHINNLARFRAKAPFLSEYEYEKLYRDHPRVHEGTDNSQACIQKIIKSVKGETLCDVGCGTGALLNHIMEAHPSLTKVTGVDFVVDDAAAISGVEYVSAYAESLPFEDNAFDTVVCTHVIEHLLDYRKAISELRRVAKKRLIIVVPREREYIYSFNPHFNFFPYAHSFLRAMHPVPVTFQCLDVGRDIFYMEDIEDE